MTPLDKYDLTVRSTILRGEKANKGLDATIAPNPNQMNRLVGYMPDGTKVVVAQRHGKGGMDFNKLLGGKVYAVAADGVSPVYEKDAEGKPTKVQKKEDGMPLYSSSGFYLLSSKEYPALEIIEAYTLLRDKGEKVWLVTEAGLAAKQLHTLSSDLDWDLTEEALKAALSDDGNMVAQYDAETNKKRERGIRRAKEDKEESEEQYEGVEFQPLEVSKKDGNPFIYFCWQAEGADKKAGAITRDIEVLEEGRKVTKYLTVDEALEHFKASTGYKELDAALSAGKTVQFAFVQGHVMRTSVSFRRKVENVLNEVTKTQYGDAVYILSALKGWTKGLISLMQSQHPNFPQADYDAHHYVAACRQAEIGMNKKKEGTGWQTPVGVQYKLSAALLP